MKIDPHYKIIVGRVYDRVSNEYPFHEQLLTASLPDELVGYVIQHRFRKGEGEWPLIQIGPGIITLNDTENYTWEDFENRISKILDTLFEVYPDPQNNLKFNSIMLRYIDAIPFDFDEDNIFAFLKDKMKTTIAFYPGLFEETGVEERPTGSNIKASFPSSKPKGTVGLRFARGKLEDEDILLWETSVQSTSEDVPSNKDELLKWLKEAHKLTDDWFFKLIEGELIRRFE